MMASTHKRAAESLFRIAQTLGAEPAAKQLKRSVQELREAWKLYREAATARMSGLPDSGRAKLHWVLCQYLVLDVVLGKPLEQSVWTAATVSAQMSLTAEGDSTEVAWAHGTLAELELLNLARAVGAPVDAAERAEDHVTEILKAPGVDPFVFGSTARQFERYVNWWGTESFAAAAQTEPLSPSLRQTARHLSQRLRNAQ